MTTDQQNYLKKVLYNHKWIKDVNDDDPFVGIYFSDLIYVIDHLKSK